MSQKQQHHNTSTDIVIECSVQPLDLSFHPTKSYLLAAALVDGTVEVHDFTNQINENQEQQQKQNNDDDDDDSDFDDTIVSSTPVHTQLIPIKNGEQVSAKQASCRAVLFSTNNDGDKLYTGGSAGDVTCLQSDLICTFNPTNNTNNKKKSIIQWRVPDDSSSTSKSPINVLHEIPKRNLLISGDESGTVRVWDPRLISNHNCNNSSNYNNIIDQSKRKLPYGCVASWKEHEDYISDMTHNTDDENTLLVTSADGTLGIYDLRMPYDIQKWQKEYGNNNKPGFIRRSDPQDDELISICIIKNGRKVICGTAEGVLDIFSYGTWGDISHRSLPGKHPSNIESIISIDENTILTGASDGLIRVVSIMPDKIIGILGEHDHGFPIEKLQFNSNKQFVGSVTHDNNIRLFDASILLDDNYHNNNTLKNDSTTTKYTTTTTTKNSNNNNNNNNTGSDDEWEDMDEDDDDDDIMDEDSDDDSDDEQQGGTTTNDKRANRFKTENEKFFDDL